jgi:integrase
MRKPYFKKSHSCWYVTDTDTRQEIRLDPDEEKAFDMWRSMCDSKTAITPAVSFKRLAHEWAELQYEDTANFQAVLRHVGLFVKHIGLKQARSLTKKDVVEWLNAPKRGRRMKDKDGQEAYGKPVVWSARSKLDAYNSVKKVMTWAVREGHLTRNPIAGIKLEHAQPRLATICRDDHARIMEASDPAFRLYLVASTCGARPKQIREVTAQDVLPDFSAWIFRTHKTSWKTGKPLVVYLPPCLQTLTRILVAAHPSGPLFRNSQGNPWKKDTVVQKIERLRTKLGLSKDFTVYAYRHTFATNALLNEVPLQTVSELLGHTDTRMVSKVYGHLDQHRNYLSEAVLRATKK